MRQATPTGAAAPTVVLIHGAFADGSGWSGVIERLQADGHRVIAAANPLRGLTVDAAYVATVVRAIEGPVLLVGHSYGGAVITNVGALVDNAVGLVYVAAFAPDEGETIQELGGRFPEVPLAAALRPASIPPSEAEAELVIDPALYRATFAADLPEAVTRVAATAQRPIGVAAFGTPSGPAAWRTLPSWFAVATGDQAIHPDEERFFAERMGATTVEIDASHSVFISQPDAIADLILTALGTLT